MKNNKKQLRNTLKNMKNMRRLSHRKLNYTNYLTSIIIIFISFLSIFLYATTTYANSANNELYQVGQYTNSNENINENMSLNMNIQENTNGAYDYSNNTNNAVNMDETPIIVSANNLNNINSNNINYSNMNNTNTNNTNVANTNINSPINQSENVYENKIHRSRTFEKISASVGIYGEIDFDINYNYNFSNNTSSFKYKENFNNPLMINNHKHSVGSQNFLNNSYFGINISYKNMYVNLEVGVLDYIRKFSFSYYFNNDLTHGITIGKTDTLAYGSIGKSELINSFYGKSILEGYGALNSNNRRLQLRYTYNNFNIALIMPFLFEGYTYGNDRAYDLYKNDKEEFLGFSYIPRIETSIDLGKDDKNQFSLFGSYAAYVFKEDTSYLNQESKNTDIVHTYSVGLKDRLEFAGNGLFDFLLWGGANLYLNNYINNSNTNPVIGYIYKSESGFDKNFLPNFRHNNVYSFGAATSLSYEFLVNKPYLKTVRPSIGVGYMGSYANGYSTIDNAVSGYFNTSFFLNDYFSITPEIGINHDLNNGINKWEGGNITVGINAKFYF